MVARERGVYEEKKNKRTAELEYEEIEERDKIRQMDER